MPNRCVAWGCNANTRKSLSTGYTRMVRFPTDPEERDRWYRNMPNTRKDLESRAQPLYVCIDHFEGDYVSSRGRTGNRPEGPPTKFANVADSEFNQSVPKRRKTTLASSEARAKHAAAVSKASDKIGISSIRTFPAEIGKRFPSYKYNVHCVDEHITLYKLDCKAQFITHSVLFAVLNDSSFGILQLKEVHVHGHPVEVKRLRLTQRSGHVHTWTTIREILQAVDTHEVSNQSRLQAALHELKNMLEDVDSPCLPFLISQLELVLKAPTAYRYSKVILIFAAELLCTSPAAYRLIRRLGNIKLPGEKALRALMNASLDDSNLPQLFNSLQPEQRLVNLLFDEVKLKAGLRFTGSHILGLSDNRPEDQATSALVIEIVCLHGGPKLVLRIHPVYKLNSQELTEQVLEAMAAVLKCGGLPLSLVCDNCPLNQAVYKKLQGPGKTRIPSLGIDIYCTYDYVHVFKNIRNNWITEKTQRLKFTLNGTEYVAAWDDVKALYKEDCSNSLRLTRLTHTSVFPKPLQRQSVPLVCQVFNQKTVSAFKSLESRVPHEKGTPILIGMVADWFSMNNVKSQFAEHRFRDSLRAPWTPNCPSFTRLNEICAVISSCTATGLLRVNQLTKFTGQAFIVTTQSNIAAAKCLLVDHGFIYVIPACFSQDDLEKFFGKSRQRNAGNFYIGVIDVTAAASAVNLHQYLKADLIPETSCGRVCQHCQSTVADADIEMLDEVTISDTQEFLTSEAALKHTIVYIAGFLTHVHRRHTTGSNGEEDCPGADTDYEVNTQFLESYSRGGLSVPMFSTVFLVHCSTHAFNKLSLSKRSCVKYLVRLLSFVESPFTSDSHVMGALANTLIKGYVISVSDQENQASCLRRREKLQAP